MECYIKCQNILEKMPDKMRIRMLRINFKWNVNVYVIKFGEVEWYVGCEKKIPARMPKIMPNGIPNKKCQNICQTKYQIQWKIHCQIDRMSE